MVELGKMFDVNFHIYIPEEGTTHKEIMRELRNAKPRLRNLQADKSGRGSILKIRSITISEFETYKEGYRHYIISVEIQEFMQSMEDIKDIENEMQALLRDATKFSNLQVTMVTLHFW